MSTNSSESPENICVVCFKNAEIYSIGCCDHMVCFECSTRMRVLCRQNECPICRQELPRVVFTCTVKPFSEIQNCSLLEDKKFQICFQNKKIQDGFYKLLEHSCSICSNSPTFKTFKNLYDHMKKEHDLYYCDLCVEHLKIFTSERQCYTSKMLDQHKKKGDADDRSHRGHPLCKFCDIRFMDNDCLYRHLRRDHLYCHFCDADGFDLYYSSYEYLREHFRTEHFLCEEGSCIDEKFTPVFRTGIDLKAHRASVHGRSLGKVAAKQARTLELEFTLKPRPRQLENAKRGRPEEAEPSSSEGATGPVSSSRANLPNLDSSEFPSLPSGASSVPVNLPPQRGRSGGLTIHAIGRRNAPLAMTEENFPVLGGYNDSCVPGTSVRLNINQERNNVGRSGRTAARNVSIHVNHRSNGEQNIRIRQDDFPALTSDKKPQPNPTVSKWTCITSKKTETPAPSTSVTTKAPKLNGADDFPSLNSKFSANLNLKSTEPPKPNFVNIKTYKDNKVEVKKERNASSVTIPITNSSPDISESGTSSNSLKVKSKKKKSKGNSIDEKSDTAKKKSQEKDLKNKCENNEKTKDITNSALPENSSSGSGPVKPLPRVEDWFESLKKSEDRCKNEKEELSEFNFSNAEVSSQSTKCNFNDFPLVRDLGCGGLTNSHNNSGRKKGSGQKVETKAPPPGFDTNNSCTNNNDIKKPPPGFSADFPISNGLTFTNSSGQSFAISTDFDYTPPVDFEKRNQNLVSKVNKIMSPAKLDQFRKKSILFRQGVHSAAEYYEHCVETMGEVGFQEIFPELLALLPDISKQVELLKVYSQSPNFSKTGKNLEVCVTCRQVITTSDLKQHLMVHSMQQNFPVLTTSDQWSK